MRVQFYLDPNNWGPNVSTNYYMDEPDAPKVGTKYIVVMDGMEYKLFEVVEVNVSRTLYQNAPGRAYAYVLLRPVPIPAIN